MPVLPGLLAAAAADPGLCEVLDHAGAPALAVEGPTALRPLLAGALAARGHTVLAVTATDREAEDLAAALADLLGLREVAHLPSWETLPHERLSPRGDTVGRRLTIFRRLVHPEPGGPPLQVVTSAVRSLLQPVAPGLADVVPIRLRIGDSHDFDGLLARLVELGYTRVEMVTARGEFTVRGGLVDVFPPTAEHPVRVELWGDEVSELRSFTVADQRSIGPVGELDAPACRELLLTDPVRARAGALARAHENNPPLRELLDRLAAGIPTEGMESLIPALVGGDMQLLTDLLPGGAYMLLADPERIRTRAQDLLRTGAEFLEASWLASAAGGAAPIDLGASAYRGLDEVLGHARDTGRRTWTLSPLTSDGDALRPGVQAVESYRGDLDRAVADLRGHVGRGGAAVIVLAGHGTAERAVERLREADVPARMAAGGLPDPPEPGLVTVTCGRLLDGFAAPSSALVVLTEPDLTGSRTSAEVRRLPSRRRDAVDLDALRPGDFVVHTQHGIGRFVEMRERTVGGATREYLVIEYAASRRGHPPDRLFVPTDQLDAMSRYVGGETPTLNKLGGADWARTKGRARKAVRQIAGQLVQLYAARQAAPGYAFAPDSPWQRELEDAFPYVETPDQLAAIDEVKADMERPVPMDRVICGDVGFGKTEIAVRAAFKAAQDGKQVAVLVPTTLLASQHLQTFTDRMRPFPVAVRGLSRFSTDAEAREVLAGMADGSVDVVIGTHRLLQTGVVWRDLGLVVVDEEQRFGVEHKEHITALRAHVDVLTLSATPIPRTLEMSLAGIREMSTITTPPEERHPVLTYVGGYDERQVAAAIRRELLRDGQVFYVHNRVSSIDRAARRVRELVPEARVAVAHGQQSSELLDRTVAGFWHGEYDVLVCTTIVESGLDISNANTLIVERSDNLGLAQLHQLRGRVGRARERGYAYFLYPPEMPLTETAHDRLATIAQHSTLGAGTAVAMKDLEIRGAGSILGAEQSGHIAGVGFDLYIRLVGEAVAAFRRQPGAGEAPAAEDLADVRVELPVDAHVPHEYVPAERLRLEAYRKIAEAPDAATLDAIVEELTDRYGEPPTPVRNLLAVAAFRQGCRRLGVSDVALTGASIRITPVPLHDSQQVRLHRLYPRAMYKAAARQVIVPRPDELRDTELLDFCATMLNGVLTPMAVPA